MTEGGPLVVVHLMIAGRLRWAELAAGAKAKPPSGKIDLAAFMFEHGVLTLTEASPKKRASLHILAGRDDLRTLAPVGLDVLACDAGDFARTLRAENRTLKRRLTDPRAFDGIGNAYSDEILHAARLSPITLTSKLGDDQCARLHAATRDTLTHWIGVLRGEFGYDPRNGSPSPSARFPGPGDITAFRPDFAVHGRFGQACPVCGHKVARIVRAENEVNYCPTCQTGGKVLADRSLSRLLGDDWPRTVEEWEG